jgi:hypothetical protein
MLALAIVIGPGEVYQTTNASVTMRLMASLVAIVLAPLVVLLFGFYLVWKLAALMLRVIVLPLARRFP